MADISDKLLSEWKLSMGITYSSRDDYYRHLLQSAVEWVDDLVGGPDIELEPIKKSLAFNRARFDFNGELEYFSESFQTEIMDLSFKYKVGELAEAEEET